MSTLGAQDALRSAASSSIPPAADKKEEEDFQSPERATSFQKQQLDSDYMEVPIEDTNRSPDVKSSISKR